MTHNVTHFESIFSCQHQQECEFIEVLAENVCFHLRFPSTCLDSDKTQLFTFNALYKKRQQRNIIYKAFGVITCSDLSTIEAIKVRATTSNDARILLLGGFASLRRHGNNMFPQQILINVLLDKPKAHQRAHCLLDLSWSRRLWSLASRANMISFTGTYYAVLGGAYSSLSKADARYAHKAGILALQQIKLAQWLKDPIAETKCWLYYAEDLIQLHQFNRARKIIKKQVRFANQMQDRILLKMCESVQLKFDTQYKRVMNKLQDKVS